MPLCVPPAPQVPWWRPSGRAQPGLPDSRKTWPICWNPGGFLEATFPHCWLEKPNYGANSRKAAEWPGPENGQESAQDSFDSLVHLGEVSPLPAPDTKKDDLIDQGRRVSHAVSRPLFWMLSCESVMCKGSPNTVSHQVQDTSNGPGQRIQSQWSPPDFTLCGLTWSMSKWTKSTMIII